MIKIHLIQYVIIITLSAETLAMHAGTCNSSSNFAATLKPNYGKTPEWFFRLNIAQYKSQDITATNIINYTTLNARLEHVRKCVLHLSKNAFNSTNTKHWMTRQ